MTATIHRFPVRPKPRPVDPREKNLPQLTEDHFERELREIARRLHEATGHFGMLATEPVGNSAITEGCIALQAALFHALTLDGCRNETMPLRQLLLSMHMKRMEG
ncbi:hypothetical protein [Neorhizobium sp. NCHU2750]|uniref:hypothetical protein n=1 Tax=Neorhizobium sp. NCHU2750 TaxID=1825976 RepID=UPI000E772275|nr:hypothetical protein NCHU2750_06000 [Neorhizobium sp. NCHU2750]